MSFFSARKNAGLSQAAVAEKLGISAASVCQWETGKTAPRSTQLPQIAKIYGCTTDELLSGNEESCTSAEQHTNNQ